LSRKKEEDEGEGEGEGEGKNDRHTWYGFIIRIQPGSDIMSDTDEEIMPSTPANWYSLGSVFGVSPPGLSVKMA
jgi:hypothetical protein